MSAKDDLINLITHSDDPECVAEQILIYMIVILSVEPVPPRMTIDWFRESL